MRKLAIAMALASTALAAPAVARDQSFYVGVEGGVLLVEDTDFDVDTTIGGRAIEVRDGVSVDHNYGLDADLIGGYDFGGFRLEGELGFKRASADDIRISSQIRGNVIPESDGDVRIYSAMVNGLFDFGEDDGWNGYVGGGLGLASVRYDLDVNRRSRDGRDIGGRGTDRSIAYQAIAGVRYAITPNLDLGLKYRFFNVNKLDYPGQFSDLKGRFRSHSLLASLIFNMGAPPPPVVILPPPPPPPPPPATQTCPDGSVILATDVCPAPPVYVPPPPPPPAPERG
ncbi:MAG TPA: outer membrane beta-barrel protein [Sphingomicrobium sp.]|nr:outer membrane beta-barrel protein [Sphingomicrobium sp.]